MPLGHSTDVAAPTALATAWTRVSCSVRRSARREAAIAWAASSHTVESSAESEDYAAAIAAGEANSKIKAPDSLNHRYYREDFGHGLVPFLALAKAAGVETPIAASLLALGESLCGIAFSRHGRTARSMGIEGLGKAELLRKVRH